MQDSSQSKCNLICFTVEEKIFQENIAKIRKKKKETTLIYLFLIIYSLIPAFIISFGPFGVAELSRS